MTVENYLAEAGAFAGLAGVLAAFAGSRCPAAYLEQ
jgi:hypothetical protein